MGVILEGQCKDDDARASYESRGAVTSCSAGKDWGFCENQPAEAPEGWFKAVCCASCSGTDNGTTAHPAGSDDGTTHATGSDDGAAGSDWQDDGAHGSDWQDDGAHGSDMHDDGAHGSDSHDDGAHACVDNDAQVNAESQGSIQDCATGKMWGYCESDPDGAPAGWLKGLCCATCGD
jgi:hypothetical protein